jgi:hypothetical protein
MARKAKRSRRHGFTIPLAVIGGLVPTAAFAAEGLKVGGPVEAAKRASMRLTGWNPWVGQWYLSEFAAGWLPILAGVVAHKLANKTGINRAIASAGIPVLRV